MTSYADDTTPLSNKTNVLTVLNDTENKASNVFDWFSKIPKNPTNRIFCLYPKKKVL